MKIFACYIFRLDGIALFDKAYYPMPETALITGMVSAMQAFIKEISGSYANKVSAGGFVFHLERIGKISIALVTSDDKRPDKIITKIRTVFISKFGKLIEQFVGLTSQFEPFDNDLKLILNIENQQERIAPKKQMTPFALLSIKPDLQKVAKEIIMAKKITTAELKSKIDVTEFKANEKLEALFDLGYIGRYYENDISIYFVE